MPHAQITQHAFMEKHATIYATYEVAPINDVAKIVVHTRGWTMMTTTSIPDVAA